MLAVKQSTVLKQYRKGMRTKNTHVQKAKLQVHGGKKYYTVIREMEEMLVILSEMWSY